MPRVTKPLSDTEVRQAKPREKEFTLWDGGGLCLRIKPSGAKSWILSYYKPGSRKRANIGLGRYPIVPLALARQQRQDCHSLLAQGLDPQAHRIQQQHIAESAHSNTVEIVATDWLKVKSPNVSEGYAKDLLRSLERHIFPTLGNRTVHDLTAREVIALLEPVSAQGKHETVKRLCQRMNDIMDFAVIKELANTNPLTGISKAFEAPRKRNLPTLQPQDLPMFLDRLADSQINITTRNLILWQLHTMTRPGEAAGTHWNEIDRKAGLWKIPANRMKKRKPHNIPLSPQSLAILDRMERISGALEHVFPGERNQKQSIHRQTANMAIKRMGYAGQLVAHGLRSMASTTLNEQAFDPDVIEAALAHSDRNEVRAAYNRAEYLKRRRIMMFWWSSHIEEASVRKLTNNGAKHLRAL